jgi:triosephosphate isomerase
MLLNVKSFGIGMDLSMARKIYVIGNWKMYKTAQEATDYIEELLPHLEGVQENIYLAVPFTSIATAATFSKDSSLVIGAQNMHDAREGAFTGEIAGLMLKEAGACFVLLGHSERRHIFGETNAWIHRKVVRALQDDLQPVLCVGETLIERNEGKTEEVLRGQIVSALEGIAKEEISKLILAYEPVWAIGTGKAATPPMVEEMHLFCRSVLVDLFGKKLSQTISILYGGSVNRENISSLMEQKNVDGVLVGGSSLNPQSFLEIIKYCSKGL